jgi:hypothetical protein
MHNYVDEQGSPHGEEMRPLLQGDRDRQGRSRAPGISMGRRLGAGAKAQAPNFQS